MLTGEYRNTIDEKGRILIPSRLRNSIPGNALIITRSIEKSLWMMLPDMYARLKEQIIGGPGAMFQKKNRLLQRRIIAPAQLCEIDRSGRVNIPPLLRESAQLNSREEAVILGIETYLELWNVAEYESFLDASEEDFAEASEALGEILMQSGKGS